jgi:hypothetical protein
MLLSSRQCSSPSPLHRVRWNCSTRARHRLGQGSPAASEIAARLLQVDDRHRAPRRLERHLVIRAEALRKHSSSARRVRTRPAERTHAPPRSAPSSRSTTRERWANDNDGFVLAPQPGQSQGRPRKARARSPSRKRPTRPAFSLGAPRPGTPEPTARTPQSGPQAESSWQEKRRRVHLHVQVLAEVLTRTDDFGRPGVLAAVAAGSGTAAAP